MANEQHIVIIGNGISGITAARHIRKNSSCRITVISGETEYFFSRTALMYIYMGHMKFEHTQPYEQDFWAKNNIDLVFDWVTSLDTDTQSLALKNGQSIQYDKLVLALGSKPNFFEWKGQELEGVQGLYSYQDLQLMEKNSQNIQQAVIVGGGLIGIEMAEMFISRGISVRFLVRESGFWSNVLPTEDSKLVGDHLAKHHHLKMDYQTELVEIVGDENGRVQKVITNTGEEIECQMVGLTAGVSPNIGLLKDTKIETDRGILVNEYLETNIENVYAIGDCAQFVQGINGRRNIEQVWYTGKFMGETLAQTLTKKRTAYNPGNWFNSAKFFDLEYQTYGWVFAQLRDGEKDFYWQNGEHAMHFVFNAESNVFIGVNTFGIRLRHEFFDQCLNESRSIEYVLEHLKEANFDPEFFRSYEQEIVNAYNSKFGTDIKVKKKAWFSFK